MVLLTASVSYRAAKRRLAERLIRQSGGGVSEFCGESTSTGVRQLSPRALINLLRRLSSLPSTIILFYKFARKQQTRSYYPR